MDPDREDSWGASRKVFFLLKEIQEVFSHPPWNIAVSGCASGTTEAILLQAGG